MIVGWDQRQVVVLGKGGVGRSTVAAAVALAAAAAGKRVVLAEINGARSLADAFGVAADGVPREVAPGVRLLSLSAARCLEEYVQDRLGIAPLARALFRTRLLAALLDGIPGMSDLLHHGKLHSLVDPARGDDVDVVVVDAPATGHGLQFLSTPEALVDMTRRGPLHDEAALIAARLADPAHTAALVVSAPEELPVAEALELVAGLGPRRGVLKGIVADRVLPELLPDTVPWEALRAALPEPWVAVGERRRARLAAQGQALARLRAGVGDVAVAELPELPVVDAAGRRALAEALARGLGAPTTRAASLPTPPPLPSPADAPLEARPAAGSPRVLLVCGVGGVGKTTLAAALGLAYARAGERAVVLTVDPARRLADALGVHLGAAPTPVPFGEGRLHAAMLDARAVLDRAVLELAADPRDARALLDNRYYRAVSARLAGAPEYAALVELNRLVADGRWSVVVVDTPPAEDALDLFRAPSRLRAVFGRSVLWSLVAPSSRLVEILGRVGTRTLATLIGGSVVDDLGAFFRAAEGVAEGLRAQGEAMAALLASDAASTWLVVDARAPERGGAASFRAALAELGPRLGGILVNRTRPDPGLPPLPSPVAPPGVPPADWASALTALAELGRIESAEASAHRALAARLGGDAPVWSVPALEPAAPRDALLALAPHLPVSVGAGTSGASAAATGGAARASGPPR